MAVSLGFLAGLKGDRSPSLLVYLTRWDGDYYRDISVLGYPDEIVQRGGELVAPGGLFAFSPLYPALVALGRVVGLSPRWAQVVVAAIAGMAASVGVHLLARRVVGTRRAGYVACALLGALPMAIVLQMGYAESVAIALGSFSLLATLHRRLWLAAGLALLAGLARPTAGVVALAIPIAAWSAGWLRSVGWPRVIAATTAGLAGMPLFWVFVWARSGVIDGWFVVQRVGWRTRFDFGADTFAFLTGGIVVHNDVMAVITFAVILGYVAACAVALRNRLAPPLLVVSVAAVVLVLGSSNFWHSKPRLLLGAFPLVVLASRRLAGWSNARLVGFVAVAVAASGWWGAYALTRWPSAI